MNQHDHDSLEAELTQLTTWNAAPPAPELWRRALDADARQKRGAAVVGRWVLNWSAPRALAAAIVLVISAAIITAIMTRPARIRGTGASLEAMAQMHSRYAAAPSLDLNEAMNQTPHDDGSGVGGGVWWGDAQNGFGHPWQRELSGGSFHEGEVTANLYSAMVATPGLFTDGTPQQIHSASVSLPGYLADVQSQKFWDDSPENRSVIRKATMELIAKDVRAAFAKALHIVSEAGDEYVQDSGITGVDEDAQATLTLRVRADRLGAVLNELRELGVVQSEKLMGEDVTAQIVDLEARLRNERRVEQELLELMDKRHDAPLKEILDLRSHISSVRQSIEQITAQRERFGRLVSLATILVIIRPEPKPAEETNPQEEKKISAYFGESVADSWHDGLLYLADSMAATLRILIGGLIWWVVAIALLLAARAHLQRRAMQ